MTSRRQLDLRRQETLVKKIASMDRQLRRLRSDKRSLEKTLRARECILACIEQRRRCDVSGVQKELSLTDIDEMIQKTNDEIELKERSIKSMEKSLANAKNRLAVLNGRKGDLKLERIKKKYGIQSDDELDELIGRLACEPITKPEDRDVSSATGKTEQKKANESADDFAQKIW